MTDITKCKGKNCPIKNQCYRYTAPANPYRQSYSDFSDFDTNRVFEHCDYFLSE